MYSRYALCHGIRKQQYLSVPAFLSTIEGTLRILDKERLGVAENSPRPLNSYCLGATDGSIEPGSACYPQSVRQNALAPDLLQHARACLTEASHRPTTSAGTFTGLCA
eukprot:120979-Amphidinium_carterae.1